MTDLGNDLKSLVVTEKGWWVSHGVISCFEYLRGSPHFSGLLDDLATTMYETRRHDDMHAAYLECNRHEQLIEEFWVVNVATSNRMVETLSAVANVPLPEFQQALDAMGSDDLEALCRLHDVPSSNADSIN
ncbi:hypothetical protein Hanom_Chr11g01058271 [Helianthus anomalus]